MDTISRALRFTNYPQFKVLLIAWVTSLILIPLLVRLAFRVGALDIPHAYKKHRGAVPFLGGVGVFAAFAVAVFSAASIVPEHIPLSTFILEEGKQLFAILSAALVIMVLGLLDDFHPVSALVKLSFIILMAYLLYEADVSLDTFKTNGVNLTLSILWITWVTSATNSLDHMDGACGGTAAVSCLFAFLFAWDAAFPQEWLSYLTAACLGALLGFLQFNLVAQPAQIFLGNNGALLVGFLLSSMTILGNWSHDWYTALAIPALLLGVPLYDITLATILRYKNGVVDSVKGAIVYNGNDHISHRLVALGYTKREAVLFLCLLQAVLGAAAYASKWIAGPWYLSVLAVIGLGLVWLGIRLDRAPVHPRRSPPARADAAKDPSRASVENAFDNP